MKWKEKKNSLRWNEKQVDNVYYLQELWISSGMNFMTEMPNLADHEDTITMYNMGLRPVNRQRETWSLY